MPWLTSTRLVVGLSVAALSQQAPAPRLPDNPRDPTAWLVIGDQLYLHCEHDGGRGSLLVLDWNDGHVVRAAYGLRDVRGLLAHGSSLLALTASGVTAFPPRRSASRRGTAINSRRRSTLSSTT